MNPLTSKMRSVFSASSNQRLWMALALILVIAGERFVRAARPVETLTFLEGIAKGLNKTLYLGLENPINVLAGITLIVIGAILFGINARHNAWAESSDEVITKSERLYRVEKWHKVLLAVAAAVFLFVMFQLGTHQYSRILVWLWLASLIIPSALLWNFDHKGGINLNPFISSRDGIWIFLLLGLGIAIGCLWLNDLPAGWHPDEALFWVTAKDIALGIKRPAFFDIGVYTFPIASSMFQAWIMRWAGIDMWGWRFASVLPAALTVVPLYLLARELFDRRVAIAACLFMIANPYFLSFARFGYNNSQALLPVTACLYLLTLGLRRNSHFYLWLAGMAAGIGFYTYFAAWLGLTTLVILLLFQLRASSAPRRLTAKHLGLTLGAALAVMLPRVLYGASGATPVALHFKIWETGAISAFYGDYVFGPERMSEARLIKITEQTNIYFDPELYAIVFARGLVRSLAGLFDPLGYKDHYTVYGMAGPGSSIIFALGLALALFRWRTYRFALASCWFALGFIFLGLLTSLPPRPTHFVSVIPAMALLAAIGLVALLDGLTAVKTSRASTWTFAALTILIGATGLFQYFFMVPFSYPVNRDDYISWLGRQIDKPAYIYLVDHLAVTRNPIDETLIRLTPHHVVSLSSEDIEGDPSRLKAWTNFAALTDTNREYANQLASQIPGVQVYPAYAPFKTLRGYVVTDLPLDTDIDMNLWRGINELWNSPARIALILCVAGIMALYGIENKDRLILLRSKIARRSQKKSIDEIE